MVADSDPPVCRIMDYGKFVYDKKKKQKESQSKQKKTKVKELKFRPGTDDGDVGIKIKKLLEFIADGDRVKVVVRFRGRELAHTELGRKLVDKIKDETANVAVVEQEPKFEGRQIIAVFAPVRKK